MGYSVLYIAFGIVALWLLGEVLLQYKARLRWRLLAFAGFMGVVGGVALREVAVILLGAVAFGTGQAFVTLSYKRGFSTGWALGGRPGSSRRRRGSPPRPAEPVLEVTPIEAEYGAGVPEGQEVLAAEPGLRDEDGQIYQPVPMHDDSGEYPLFDGQSSYTPDPYTSGGYEGYGAQGYGGWDGEPQPASAAASYDGAYQGGGYDQSGGWGGQDHGYDQAAAYQQQHPAAAAYDGYQTYDASTGYNGYGGDNGRVGGGYGTGDWTPSNGEQQPAADPYAAYGYDPQPQPYIPQQQHQSPYEQQPQSPPQGQHRGHDQQQVQQQYADPYDPYRY
ncbi:hypothetical protein V2S66_06400 [Streptomyces sp. V4-01]|uniref:Uncharacterized protein n=1 Tax=Actinacidiphila polyblastidii TaxID=3110430 RepID=A0ABU7P721_9ACTN|nr:hypothetical protein [Streptomyces sp. V4-01]